jgi:hypothetical protein
MVGGLSRQSNPFEIKKSRIMPDVWGWVGSRGVELFWPAPYDTIFPESMVPADAIVKPLNLNLVARLGHHYLEIRDFSDHPQKIITPLAPFIALYMHQGERAGFSPARKIDAAFRGPVSRDIGVQAKSLVNYEIDALRKCERLIGCKPVSAVEDGFAAAFDSNGKVFLSMPVYSASPCNAGRFHRLARFDRKKTDIVGKLAQHGRICQFDTLRHYLVYRALAQDE